MEKKIYEYLRDVLCPNDSRGNVHYSEMCSAIGGDLSPLEIVAILNHLIKEGKIDARISTYAAYVVLK